MCTIPDRMCYFIIKKDLERNFLLSVEIMISVSKSLAIFDNQTLQSQLSKINITY